MWQSYWKSPGLDHKRQPYTHHRQNETALNESELFNAALKLSLNERAKFLDQACKSNPELRVQVGALLKAHFDSATFLHESDDKPQDRRLMETMAPERSAEHPGTIIAGRYKLLEAIGEGGMGSVWVRCGALRCTCRPNILLRSKWSDASIEALARPGRKNWDINCVTSKNCVRNPVLEIS